MTKQEMSIKLKAAIKADDKATIIGIMSPVLDKLAMMIVQGILIKNVKRHLVHAGIAGECCDMIAEMAKIRAEKFMCNKAK